MRVCIPLAVLEHAVLSPYSPLSSVLVPDPGLADRLPPNLLIHLLRIHLLHLLLNEPLHELQIRPHLSDLLSWLNDMERTSAQLGQVRVVDGPGGEAHLSILVLELRNRPFDLLTELSIVEERLKVVGVGLAHHAHSILQVRHLVAVFECLPLIFSRQRIVFPRLAPLFLRF